MASAPAARDDGARQVGTIDLTPTWRGLVPLIVEGIRNGTDAGRAIAIEELYRLADFADEANRA